MAPKPTIYAIGDDALMNLAEKMSGGSGAGSGAGSGGGSLEARVAKVEASMEHIQADVSAIKSDLRDLKKEANHDFRILFGAIITVTLGLAGLMAKGFHWL
jgi:hypothetical protein